MRKWPLLRLVWGWGRVFRCHLLDLEEVDVHARFGHLGLRNLGRFFIHKTVVANSKTNFKMHGLLSWDWNELTENRHQNYNYLFMLNQNYCEKKKSKCCFVSSIFLWFQPGRNLQVWPNRNSSLNLKKNSGWAGIPLAHYVAGLFKRAASIDHSIFFAAACIPKRPVFQSGQYFRGQYFRTASISERSVFQNGQYFRVASTAARTVNILDCWFYLISNK